MGTEDDVAPLTALADREIGTAVRLVHEHPERAWTVDELARTVALSRSAFAARFRALAGEPPMRYVARCRLVRAGDLLRETDSGLKEIARVCGFGSEAALSRAFRRWFGLPPGEHRRRSCSLAA